MGLRAFGRLVRLVGMGGILTILVASPAAAVGYRVGGHFVDAGTGTSSRVAGALVLEQVELAIDRQGARTVVPESFFVTDFAIALADRILTPAPPLEFEGLRPLVPQIADSLLRDRRDLLFFALRAGGDLRALTADEATFRHVRLRSERGSVRGKLRGSDYPARFGLVGELVLLEQTFELRREPCAAFPLPGGGGDPGGGGGVVIGAVPPLRGFIERRAGGSEFGRRTFLFLPPEDLEEGPFRDVRDEDFPGSREPVDKTLASELDIGSSADAIVAALGIEETSGVEALDDGAGAITLTTAGDLVLAGGALVLSDLSHLTLEAGGDIRIEGSLSLPAGVTLELVATRRVELAPDVVISIPDVGTPRPSPNLLFCPGLLPVAPAVERPLGTLHLEAVHERTPERAPARPGPRRHGRPAR
jgi:hypothetical protein